MAIQDLRNTIRRMEKRERELIQLLRQANQITSDADLLNLDCHIGDDCEEWLRQCAEILGPNWRG